MSGHPVTGAVTTNDLFDVVCPSGHDLGKLNSPFMISVFCEECGGWVWTVRKTGGA